MERGEDLALLVHDHAAAERRELLGTRSPPANGSRRATAGSCGRPSRRPGAQAWSTWTRSSARPRACRPTRRPVDHRVGTDRHDGGEQRGRERTQPSAARGLGSRSVGGAGGSDGMDRAAAGAPSGWGGSRHRAPPYGRQHRHQPR